MDALTTPVPDRHRDRARILLLAALGLTLTFGQMGVINMANGEFLMVGAYVAYVTQQVISSAGDLDPGRAAGGLRRRRPARPAAGGLASSNGCTSGRSTRCWRRSVSAWSCSRLRQDIFGAQGDPVERAELARRAASRCSATSGRYRQLFTIVLALGCVAALSAVLKYSSFGRRIRATVQNRELAETMGDLHPQRRPHHLLPRLGPGRGRRSGHRLISGTNPTLGTHVHHPGLPRRRRRRRRPAQGHGDRRVGGRRGHCRSSPTGPAAAWRRSSPSSSWWSSSGPPAGPVHRPDEVAGMTTTHRTRSDAARPGLKPRLVRSLGIGAVRRPAPRRCAPGSCSPFLARQPRQVLLLGDRRRGHRPGLGSWRHARHGPGRVLRPRRLLDGHAHEARGRRPGRGARLHGALRRRARCRRGGSRSAAGRSPCSRSCVLPVIVAFVLGYAHLQAPGEGRVLRDPHPGARRRARRC